MEDINVVSEFCFDINPETIVQTDSVLLLKLYVTYDDYRLDNDHYILFRQAAQKGSYKLIKYYVDNIELTESCVCAAYRRAVCHGHYRILQLLLTTGLVNTNYCRRALTDLAKRNGHTRVVALLQGN